MSKLKFRISIAQAHTDYRDYYTPETAKLVAFHWAEDILRFGYTFDEGGK